MGVNDVIQFLDQLAFDQNVTANAQRGALNSIVFLYCKILDKPLANYAK